MYQVDRMHTLSSPRQERVRLLIPVDGAEFQFEDMLEEIRAAGETQHHGLFAIGENGSFDKYVQLLTHLRGQLNEAKDVFPIDTYFIYEYGKLVGEVRIRHQMPPELEEIGGHITLYIRPSARMRGLASLVLPKALENAHERGLRALLLSTLARNLGAIKVLEKSGGIRIKDIESPVGVFQRYRFFL